jgi:hypothetical protein
MNKRFKPFFVTAILAIFGIASAQAPVAAPAPVATPAPAAPAAAPAPAAPKAPAATPVPTATPAPAAPAPVATPAPAAPKAPATAAPVTTSVETAQVPATAQADTNAVKPKPEKKKKKKIEFATVDFPATFEIQARKVMPVDSEGWEDNNLDTWWGRANLMVETQSESFKGRVHMRMYPGEFKDKISTANGTPLVRDQFEIYEAWAWHKGDYFNFKIGRWSNTTRFGSQTFGGYIDAKNDKNLDKDKGNVSREAGFMSTYYPENSILFGYNVSEDISIDLSLISSDKNLNKGDLRIYLHLEDLANVNGLNVGVGYRSNLFDEVYSKYGDVTHTIALAGNLPILTDVGFLKNMNLFVETALIGIDDQNGTATDSDCSDKVSKLCRSDKGKLNSFDRPILAGLEIDLYRSFDKIVIEAEYDTHRKNNGTKEHVKDILGSIYVKKQLNERFNINLGMQSENNTKDFSFAGRLQGKIN